MAKISAVYKITNTVTNDFYIGSSKDVKRRWTAHKCPSRWNEHPNSKLYKDMQKYGVDSFVFEILAEVEIDKLKKTEQEFIEALKPVYNNYNANGLNIEKRKKSNEKYQKSDKRKEYEKSAKYKESHRKSQKKYEKSDKRKKYHKEYDNQLCCYNGEILTLHALRTRFAYHGIEHPTLEAKKYLIENYLPIQN